MRNCGGEKCERLLFAEGVLFGEAALFAERVLERALWPPPPRRRFRCSGLLTLSLLISTTEEEAFRFLCVSAESLFFNATKPGDCDGRGRSRGNLLSAARSPTAEEARSATPEEATDCARGGGTCQSYKKKKRKQSYARTHRPLIKHIITPLIKHVIRRRSGV